MTHRKGEKNKNADALTGLELPTQNSNTVISEKEATMEIDAFTLGHQSNSQSMSNATDSSESTPIIGQLYYDCTPLVANVDVTDNNEKAENTQMSDKQKNCPDFKVSQRQTESGQTLRIRINHNRSIALERSVINYGGLKLSAFMSTANAQMTTLMKVSVKTMRLFQNSIFP